MSLCDNCPGYAAPGCCLRMFVIAEQVSNASQMAAKMHALETEQLFMNRQQRRAAQRKARKSQ